jgi:hypothetical protein
MESLLHVEKWLRAFSANVMSKLSRRSSSSDSWNSARGSSAGSSLIANLLQADSGAGVRSRGRAGSALSSGDCRRFVLQTLPWQDVGRSSVLGVPRKLEGRESTGAEGVSSSTTRSLTSKSC